MSYAMTIDNAPAPRMRSDLEQGMSYADYEQDTRQQTRKSLVWDTPPAIETVTYPHWQRKVQEEQHQERVQLALQAFDLIVLTIFSTLGSVVLYRLIPFDHLPVWTLIVLSSLFLLVSLVIRHVLFVQRHKAKTPSPRTLHSHQY